jgi:hypothetical protein
VENEYISNFFSDKNIPLDDPAFYQEAFSLACLERRKKYLREADNFKRTCVEEYDELSIRLDKTKFQESCSVRNILRTRRLANLLINDSGELNIAVLPKLMDLLQRSLYSIGPNRQYDAKRQEHLLRVVTLLNEDKDLQRALKVIDKPISHKYAEQIIRDTLQIPANVSLTDAHTRRAVLSAWMCLLRQNVGSCFATAPAIIIHDEQPAMFFKDISELLSTGRLKRTFGGIEYSVPLSSSWGAGDLKKPFILYLGEAFDKSYLWLSPGLETAFLAIGLLDPDSEIETNVNTIKTLLLNILPDLPQNQYYTIITAEEIIRRIILKQLGITEQDVHEYENRPHSMIHGGLMMHVIPSGPSVKSKGKGELSSTFLSQFSIACNAFKALADNALLKAWEFTVASFAEIKSQFTRWNLYASLGLGPNEAGGIGAVLYEIIKRKVDFFNQRVQEVQQEYELVFSHLKSMEMRMRSASSEKEVQWIKMEYQSKRNEFNTLEEMRDEMHNKAQRFANLFDTLIEQYDILFPKYFQEVYDADMHDITAGPYDDSPAGFRLLYKFGRSNTSQWTRIKTPNEFIEDLAAFFTATETEIVSTQHFEGMQSEISDIITAIVTHVRTKEFLETAFHRMAVAHQMPIIKDPLEHLDKIEKKPWAYTSGGTMGTLVSCYYRREQKPTEVSKWVESPIELLVFLVDSLKQIPSNLTDPYLSNPDKSMLIHSPTHAFLLKPGMTLFKKAWQTDAFTYTWVRDNIVAPQQKIIDSIWLDEGSIHFLIEYLSQHIPQDYRHYFRKVFSNIYGNMRPTEFRDYILDGLQKERGLRQAGGTLLSADEIDGALYSLLPLTPRSSLRETLKKLYKAIPSIDTSFRKRMMAIYDAIAVPYIMQSAISSKALQDMAKAFIILASEETSFNIDYHAIISHAAKKLGLAMPAPIIFADTNWVKEEFGLVVNPGSGRFELWRIDTIGTSGAPMSSWEQWLNGTRQDITWGVYSRPYEYT